MMVRLGRQVRSIVERARHEARDLHSPTLEAEHILLAISSQDANVGKEVLLEFGLDHDALVNALAAEFQQSLSAAGVKVEYLGELEYSDAPQKTPVWGTSAKLVMMRGKELAASRADSRIEAPHLLLAALKAHEGTVPRMLHVIGVDQAVLLRRTEQVLPQLLPI
ncbi:MAG: hypothetical protein M5U22_14765 [Thermoleophilia bacterium]|nr:hypothetical protein [Thermoleophilia bacterium]